MSLPLKGVGVSVRSFRSLGGQAAVTSLGMMFAQAGAFLSVLLLAKGLGPEEVGRYQLLVSTVIVVSYVSKLGVDEGLSYYLPTHKISGTVGTVILASTGTVLVLSILIGASISQLAPHLNTWIFQLEGFETELRLFYLLLPSYMMLLIMMAALRGLGRSDLRAYLGYFGLNGVFIISLGVLLLSSSMSVAAVVILRSSVLLASGVLGLLFVLAVARNGLKPTGRQDLRLLFQTSFLMIPVGLMQYLAEQPFIDLAFVGRLASPEAVGVYSVASRLGALVLLPGNAITMVIGPRFSQLSSSDSRPQLRQLHHNASEWGAWLAILGATLVGTLAEDLLLVFGHEYTGGAGILRVFAVGYAVLSLFGVNAPLLLALRYQKREMQISLCSLVVMVLLDAILGKLLGPVGIALGTTGALVLAALLRLRVVSREFDMPARPTQLATPILPAVSGAIAAYYLLAAVGGTWAVVFRLAVGGGTLLIVFVVFELIRRAITRGRRVSG